MCQINDIDVCITMLKRRKNFIERIHKKIEIKEEIDYKLNELNHIRLVIESMHVYSFKYQNVYFMTPYADEENFLIIKLSA